MNLITDNLSSHISGGIMKRLAELLFFALALCLAAFSPRLIGAAPKGSNWSQWRGPDGLGVSSESNLPAEWGENKNIKWKTSLTGRGHSSPIVWENKIFLTADVEGDIVPGAKAVEHKIE